VSSFGRRRVVVTGLGVVSPLGHDTAHVFDALCRGESGVRPIRRFDTTHCRAKIGGTVEDLDVAALVPDRAGQLMLRLADWVQTMAFCATELAVRDAGVGPGAVARERLGVFFGAGRGGAEVSEALLALVAEAAEDWPRLRERDPDALYSRLAGSVFGALNRVRPTSYLQQCPTFVSGFLSIRHGAAGPMLTNVNLCSAGAQAIGEAAWVIARDDADVMLAGGADSMLNAAELTAFSNLDAVSARNDEGPEACKPFDLRRDGCVVGEGAAALVLEEREHARRRGARIYAELLGYGASSDAHKPTAPPEDGRGAVLAMERALGHAGLDAADVGHVNAHGTGTPANDVVETAAIKRVLGAHAHRIPVVSTKSMTGHLIAGAGALEAAIAVRCLAERRVPPTRNLRVPDPRCDLDYAADGARALPDLGVVMSNSFAIGGSNACLVFGRPRG
jgi:3-oxoacyl-[acyl-carrier-protein] synthase II